MQQKFIFLWGPSRSVSTAMQKAFQQRRDTITLFEPFADTYYFSTDRYTKMYGDKPEVAHRTFSYTCDEVFACAAPVIFMKEMAYFVSPYDFANFLDKATNTFIIRDPVLTLASRKRERKDEIGEHEFGFTAAKALWDHLCSRNPDTRPVIVDGERLRKDPEKVLRSYCEQIGLDFDPAMLTWAPGPIREFEPYEAESHKRWHKTLDTSSGFIKGAEIGGTLDMDTLTDSERAMLSRASSIYAELLVHTI